MHTHLLEHTLLQECSATKLGNNTYHSRCLCDIFFPPPSRSVSLPLFLALSPFHCVSAPIYYPFCSTVYSIHKQIQLLHFIQPVISLVDCTTACNNTRETEKYATNSPRTTISGNSVLFVRRWELLLCVFVEFMLCFSMEIINYPVCKWEQFSVRKYGNYYWTE